MIEVFIKMDWFKGWFIERKEGNVSGKIFLEVLDFILLLKRLIDLFFRFLFQDVYKIGGILNVVIY